MGQPGGARRQALAALFVVAAAGLSLARQSGAGALDTVYAEDGSVFLASAFSQSTLDSLSTPYAGYLHLVPRLLSELVSLLPVSSAAAGVAVLAALTTGLLALLVFVASRDHLPSLPARLLVSTVVVLVPVGQEELPNSIANLHWPALYALFWVLLWRPTSRAGRIVAIAAVALISLSDLLSLVFAPLALWLWWRRRDRHSLTLGIALAVGLVTQFSVVLFGQSERVLTPEPVMWAPWYAIRAVPVGVLGQRLFPADVNTLWLAFAAVAWLLVAAVLVFAWRRGLTGWRLAALAGAYSVAVYALPVALSGQATPRYAAAPAMLLVTAFAALLIGREPWKLSAAGIVLIVFCAAVWAVNLRVPNDRSTGPTWSDEVRQAEQTCTSKVPPSLPQHTDAEMEARVDISLAPAGWKMSVPCREVLAWD
ncbi:MAG TPA: hypothetical protein DGT23_05190 [Micromonosporaceae bacterium]|nr:hypothetical protein [Micromonosporaceae bacterium]